jgi:uncharacterized membrane protein YedE/YeeE
MFTYGPAFAGGMLIGAAAVLLLIVNGRIAGVSGILGKLIGGRDAPTNAAFLIGLVLGPLVFAAILGRWPSVAISASWPLASVSGLLVGFGTRMGHGCTSGHGVIRLARFSKRSIAATAVFLAAGVVTATTLGALR